MVEHSDNSVYIFFHVPKTGGTSLRVLFQNQLVQGKGFVNHSPTSRRFSRLGNIPIFEEMSPQARANLRVIAGHDVDIHTQEQVPGKDPRHIVFFRDPASRFVSAYNFEMSDAYTGGWDEPVDFEYWYARQERDVMTKGVGKRILSNKVWKLWAKVERGIQYKMKKGSRSWLLDEVIRVLESFYFVGCTEHLDRDTPLLLDRIGVTNDNGDLDRKNVAGQDFAKRLKLTPELKQRLLKENPLDTKLHQYWLNRLDQSVARLKAEE